MRRKPLVVEFIEPKIDPRGLLVEPLDASAIGPQRNSHLVVTRAGAVRGNHFHQLATEIIVVIGPALIRVDESRNGAAQDIRVDEGRVLRITVPPGVAHAVQGTGSGPLVLVSFMNREFDRANPDTHAYHLLSPMPPADGADGGAALA